MKTLADMTPEERAQCVGMWCEIAGQLEILAEPDGMVDYHDTVILHSVKRNGGGYVLAKDATPRFDLPRAWNPDGTPPKGEWADGHMWWGEDTDTMQPADLVGAECLATGQVQGLSEWPEGVTPGEDVPVRRFISEWEEI